MELTRREMANLSLGTAVAFAFRPLSNLFAQTSLITKPIPSTGQRLPVVGIGTRDFGGGSPVSQSEIKDVLRQFSELGGKVIDTAADYQDGASETLIGNLVSELGNRDRLFLATKVEARDRADGLQQIERSFRRLRTDRIDLFMVHNISDALTQLATLREMKKAGRIRYVGMSTSFESQYQDFEQLMKSQAMDFIEVDYALDNRKAGDRILPLAADRGLAVLINLPFGRGRLFRAVRDKTLPEWAKEIDCATWAQVFLKYIVSHPAVTCAIPGTRRVEHLLDNMQAARGRLPDASLRRRMEQFVDTL
jgi:aryl-alcohol dehydrogenase-like predicted oxidoreductase